MIKFLFIRYLLKKALLFGVAVSVSLLALVGLDFTTYRQLTEQQEIMTIRITETSPTNYLLTLQTEDQTDDHQESAAEETQQFELSGDQWQIDFRLIRFSPLVALTGYSYLYQPERLSNRYQAIEDQRSEALQFYALRPTGNFPPDFWYYLKKHSGLLPMIDAAFGGSVFMPLKDGAEYRILIGFSGLVVQAVNEAGVEAMVNWQ